jgi:hypothetical protein
VWTVSQDDTLAQLKVCKSSSPNVSWDELNAVVLICGHCHLQSVADPYKDVVPPSVSPNLLGQAHEERLSLAPPVPHGLGYRSGNPCWSWLHSSFRLRSKPSRQVHRDAYHLVSHFRHEHRDGLHRLLGAYARCPETTASS